MCYVIYRIDLQYPGCLLYSLLNPIVDANVNSREEGEDFIIFIETLEGRPIPSIRYLLAGLSSSSESTALPIFAISELVK